jgi:hypothetical protein
MLQVLGHTEVSEVNLDDLYKLAAAGQLAVFARARWNNLEKIMYRYQSNPQKRYYATVPDDPETQRRIESIIKLVESATAETRRAAYHRRYRIIVR